MSEILFYFTTNQESLTVFFFFFGFQLATSKAGTGAAKMKPIIFHCPTRSQESQAGSVYRQILVDSEGRGCNFRETDLCKNSP